MIWSAGGPVATGVGIAFRPEEADLFAAAPELVDVVREVVEHAVESGAACDDPTLACECFVCRGIGLLAGLEGPGRCRICGCDEEHGCAPSGCSWADETRQLCDRHPPEDLATARAVLAEEASRG